MHRDVRKRTTAVVWLVMVCSPGLLLCVWLRRCQVKMTDKACAEGFPITALRETNVLLALRHENIVRVKEMVVGSSQDKVYMVMECLDHELKALLDTMEQPFDQAEIKCLMQQILSSVAFMHANWCVLWP